MSMKYGLNDTVPTSVLCARLDELATAVTKGGNAVSREFTMRIPAECDRDADLILSEASQRIRELTMLVRILTNRLERYTPGTDVAARAKEYLNARHSPADTLREDESAPTAE